MGILTGCTTVPSPQSLEPPPDGYRFIPCSYSEQASNFHPLCMTGKMLQKIPEVVPPVYSRVQIPNPISISRAPSKALRNELKGLSDILERK